MMAILPGCQLRVAREPQVGAATSVKTAQPFDLYDQLAPAQTGYSR